MAPTEAAQQPAVPISASEIGRLIKDHAPQPLVFLDASPPDIRQRVWLTGSVRSSELNAGKHPYPLSTTVVAYDFSLGGNGATESARAWVDTGYKSTYVLRGGFANVRDAKMLVDATADPADVLPYGVTVQSLAEALKRKEEMVIVDLRSDIEFSVDQIPGAINIKYSELLTPALLVKKFAIVDKTKWLVLYDSQGNSLDPLIWQLRKMGYIQTVSLFGGYKAWVGVQGPKPVAGR